MIRRRRVGRLMGNAAVAVLVAAALASLAIISLRERPGADVAGAPPASASASDSASPTPSPASVSTQALPPPAAFVDWLPLAPRGVDPQAPVATPSPPLAVPQSTPACRAGQLEGMETDGGAATGNVGERILLRNTSGIACYLEGYPDVSILDSSGRVLASAAGPANRGTFFDLSLQVVPIVMQPGTPELSASEEVGTSGVGQAYLNLTWYECHPNVQAAVAALQLPDSGGRLLVPFAIRSPYSPACDAATTTLIELSRGPMHASGYLNQPTPVFINVTISIQAPASVAAGSTLTYYVTVRDADSSGYDLSRCPDYDEMLRAKEPWASYQLNCSPVGAIGPSGSRTFQMQMSIPVTVAAGPNTLYWDLIDGRVGLPAASTSINIVPS